MAIDQVDKGFFAEHGYINVSPVLGGKKLRALRAETDTIVQAASGAEGNNEIYDLEATHTPKIPRVRRIKTPHLFFPVFEDLARDPYITDPVAAASDERPNFPGRSVPDWHPAGAPDGGPRSAAISVAGAEHFQRGPGMGPAAAILPLTAPLWH